MNTNLEKAKESTAQSMHTHGLKSCKAVEAHGRM